jgi:hypothetical protein
VVHATASVEDLESGHLPSVCAKTGLPAEGFTSVRFSKLPGWTWILLLFGIWPFLIAWYFATRRINGLVPMSDLALRRVRAFTLTYAIFFTLAVVVFLIGAFGEHPTLVWLGIITALLTLVFISIGWLFVYPTGRFLDQDWISLSFVDKRFATELDRWYGESRLATGIQSGGAGGGGASWTWILIWAIVAVLLIAAFGICTQPTSFG